MGLGNDHATYGGMRGEAFNLRLEGVQYRAIGATPTAARVFSNLKR